MISVKSMIRVAKINHALGVSSEHVYGQVIGASELNRGTGGFIKKTSFKSKLSDEMREICKVCRAKLNLPTDKFYNNLLPAHMQKAINNMRNL